MARFADEVIERIKAEVSLVRLAESQGYALVKQGKDVAVCCPFHNDKTPSCVISPSSNLFNCFGCGAGGSVIDWVMKTQGVSFRHAVELLKNDIGAVTSSLAAESPIKKTTVPKLAAPVSSDVDDVKLLREVVDYYHETLLQSPEAIAYLESRGLNDPELINHFKLGHANRTLGLRLPHKNRKAGAELREKLQHVGVYRESGHEHLNGSLVIPLLNKSGDVVQLYGRKLLNNLREGTAYHLYLPGDHAGVFNYADLVGCEEIILCEALIDALTFWRWGFKNVTSSYGVNGFTDELLQTLVELKIKRVLIAYDRDDAGNVAAEKVAKQLNENGIDAFRLLFPKGMDANEYVDQMVPAPKALELVIRSAQWLGSGRAPQVTTQLLHEGDTEKCPTVGQQVMSLDSKMEQPSASAISSLAVDVLASPVPPLPPAQLVLETRNDGLYAQLGEGAQARMYRVRGFEQNSGAEQLKIQLYVQRGEAFFIDKLDLYSSKQRQIFINQACVELGVSDEIIKKDLGKVLLALEQEQLKKSDENRNPASANQSITNEEREAALALLSDKKLPQRILSDFALAGVVGEETNKLVGYLAGVSRKLDRPLAVVIQSSSAAGKSSLMDAVLSFMPEDERVQYSAMTGQSLFYMGETRLKNKILAISEEEGAHSASYALKLLQSEGEVTIASTGKDDSSGQLVTREYKVEGPVMLFLTTTAIDIDEELLNRCLVLTVNESREQTEAIHHAQRLKRTLKGLESKIKKEQVLQLHRNAQRLLKPLAVINPYADQLTFLSDKTRTRRDHEKYLTLIDSIALLHQYQREIKTLGALNYVEVTPQDIALANQLAHEVLGKTLDELPPQTRKLLKEIQLWVQQSCKVDGIEQRDFRFSRKQLRDVTGWGNTQLKVHLARLEDMEFLAMHNVPRSKAIAYELLFDGSTNNDTPHLMGLLDVDCLQRNNETYTYDKQKSGQEKEKPVSGRSQVGAVSDTKNPLESSNDAALPELQKDWVENAYLAV